MTDWLGRRRDGKYAATLCGLAVGRQNGKNGAIEIRELFGMIELGEKFLHTAHEVKTSRKAFKRLKHFFGETDNDPNARYPELNALVAEVRNTNGQEAIVLVDVKDEDGNFIRSGGSVEFVARSKGSGRGFTVDVLVLDEAQQLSEDELEALLSTISSAMSAPQLIITGTPPNPDKGQTAEVFTRVRNGQKTNKSLSWTDFGVADGPLPDIDDPDLLAATNPALGTRLHQEVLDLERSLLSPEGFARERFGWWGNGAQGKSVFGTGNWEACGKKNGTEPTEGLVLGLALSVNGETASLAASAPNSDGSRHVGVIDRQKGTAWVVDALVTADLSVVIDERGPAGFLIPSLTSAGVDVVIAKTNDVIEGCATLFDRVQKLTLTHFGYPELDAAVTGAAKRAVGDRWAWGRKLSTFDVSMLEAATLASWGVDQCANYDVLDSIL